MSCRWEEEESREVVEAARLAPSACNGQPWRFVAARGEAKRRLAEEALGGLFVPSNWAKTAPVIIAVEHLVLRAAELGLGIC